MTSTCVVKIFFKADLDADYKAICSNKQPVELELFRDDVAARLKTDKESKNATEQLPTRKKETGGTAY